MIPAVKIQILNFHRTGDLNDIEWEEPIADALRPTAASSIFYNVEVNRKKSLLYIPDKTITLFKTLIEAGDLRLHETTEIKDTGFATVERLSFLDYFDARNGKMIPMALLLHNIDFTTFSAKLASCAKVEAQKAAAQKLRR